MKQFSVVFLMVMFLANVFVVSAWAKPCMTADHEMAETSQNADRGKVPCHEENEQEEKDSQKSKTQHCDGVCLCLHVSTTQIPLLTNLVVVSDISLGRDRHNPSHENASSQDYSPSNPPPIFNS